MKNLEQIQEILSQPLIGVGIEDIEQYFVKAKIRSLDTGETMDKWIKGLLLKGPDRDFYIDTCVNEEPYTWINKDTICRNSGMKDSEGNYVYQNDVVTLINLNNTNELYVIKYDDFYGKYITNGGYKETIRVKKIIDNYLNASGEQLIEKQEEKDNLDYVERQKYKTAKSETCLTKQYKNKKAKMFLPN